MCWIAPVRNLCQDLRTTSTTQLPPCLPHTCTYTYIATNEAATSKWVIQPTWNSTGRHTWPSTVSLSPSLNEFWNTAFAYLALGYLLHFQSAAIILPVVVLQNLLIYHQVNLAPQFRSIQNSGEKCKRTFRLSQVNNSTWLTNEVNTCKEEKNDLYQNPFACTYVIWTTKPMLLCMNAPCMNANN